MSKDDKPILRMGEWVGENLYKYQWTIVYSKAELDLSSGNTGVKIKDVTQNVVTPENLVRIFKDYDAYVDSKFNL